LSVTVSVAEELPAVAGVNVTLMLQDALGATVAPQVVVCVKAAAAPVMATAGLDKPPCPELVRTTI
jgi:hypothetical protein